ncbi:MAG: V-type ATP synthase subunit F [Thermoproteota archaeon]|jgi:vacuolar-type H+-ATPase subunit F/Vma7|nr:V-type ATP synthase subunit F [Thermoproteota archaeon]
MKKIVAIGDEEFVLGFSLVGCEGYIEERPDKILRLIKELINNQEIGLILVNDKLTQNIKKEIQEIKLKTNSPLIYEVPGPGSVKKTEDYRKLIRQILGF